MEQELKIKKGKVWFGFSFCLFLAVIVTFSLFMRFSINLFDAQKPLLFMNYAAKNKSALMVPFFWFFLQLFLIFYYLKMLYEWYILGRKGYVARMEADGVHLANDRVIPWHEIETIEAFEKSFRTSDKIVITLKEAPTRNKIHKLFQKMSNERIILSQFELPLNEAYETLDDYWKQHRNNH